MGMGSAGLYLSGLVLGLSLSIRSSLKDGGGEKGGGGAGQGAGEEQEDQTPCILGDSEFPEQLSSRQILNKSFLPVRFILY